MYTDELNQLACHFLGEDYNLLQEKYSEDELYNLLENQLAEEMFISMETFEQIANKLLELTPIMRSELTGTKYHCFGTYENDIFQTITQLKYKV